MDIAIRIQYLTFESFNNGLISKFQGRIINTDENNHAENQRKGNEHTSKKLKHPIVARARTRSVRRVLSSFEGILFLLI